MPKANSPAEAIGIYRRSLPPGGRLVDFRIDGLDHIGIPIVNVDYFLPGGRDYNGIGYGATEELARRGAYGELCEELHLIETFNQQVGAAQRGCHADMVNRYGAGNVIDPLTLVLPAGADYTERTELPWMKITAVADSRDVWCPAEFVATYDKLIDYPEKLTTCIRNGSGAGDTLERALLHGVLELLQRDGNADAFRALDRGLVIDPDTLPQDIRGLIEDMRAKQLAVTVKLARTTCRAVSVYAVGDDLSGDDFALAVTACGEGADLDTASAIKKAVLECASSHSRKRYNNLPFSEKAHLMPEGTEERLRSIPLDKEEPRALRAMYDWNEMSADELRELLSENVFSERERIDFNELPKFPDDSVESKWPQVRRNIEAEGMELFYHRATTNNGHGEIAKVIVPGIEMELASYHRIGERGVGRLLERKELDLIKRKTGNGYKRILLTQEAEERLGGPVWLDAARLDEIVDPYYALYREPTSHAAILAKEQNYFG